MVVSLLFRRMFYIVLGLGLLGYAFLGRGFAYIGLPPFYVDALLLGLAALMLFFNPGWSALLKRPIVWPLLAFIILGIVRTVPYVSVYGLDALRDAAIWIYGLFALSVAYVSRRERLWLRVAQWYSKWIYFYVVWIPIALILYYTFGGQLPRFPWGPGGGVPILSPKGGDIAVHLAGALAFYLLVSPYMEQRRLLFNQWLFWPAWLVSFALVAFRVRAAFLLIFVSGVILALHVNFTRWAKVAMLLAGLVAIFAVSGIQIDLGTERKVSFSQLITNVTSIFGEAKGFSGEGSKRWRLEWWRTIVQYTIRGEYFWNGKGFGINLADADGFQVTADHSLRSPHNGHLTVLARMGVPGMLLWLALQTWYGIALWLIYWRRKLKRDPAAGLFLWLLIYWLGAMINAAFDVYLEGPQGGVWFWSIYGFGLSMILGDKDARNVSTHILSIPRR